MKKKKWFLKSGFDRPLTFMGKKICRNCHHYDEGYCYYNDEMVSPNYGCAWYS